MTDYPRPLAQIDQIEPVPRRIRAILGGQTVLDTTAACYVWEWPHYPQFYIPVTDIDAAVLIDEQREQHLSRGTARMHGLKAGGVERPAAVRVYGTDALAGLGDTARIEWDALDAWFEEDERVYVHPRNPYTRVDAVRSSRTVKIELDQVVLAESSAPVMVFETGLPTRYYLDPTAIDFAHLRASTTITACPYKGVTTGYWTAQLRSEHPDIAWTYAFPTRQLLPIAGLVAFYNEQVDITIDGTPLPRPITKFSPPTDRRQHPPTDTERTT
jgi:uncharacterized protein (DUF427 family)